MRYAATALYIWPAWQVVDRTFPFAWWTAAALTIVFAAAFASLTIHVARPAVLPVALAALVVTPAILPDDNTRSGSLAFAHAVAVGDTPLPADWQTVRDDKLPVPRCDEPSGCTLVHGDGPHVLVMGDSHAVMLLPAFRLVAERESLTLSAAVLQACPCRSVSNTPLGPDGCATAVAPRPTGTGSSSRRSILTSSYWPTGRYSTLSTPSPA